MKELLRVLFSGVVFWAAGTVSTDAAVAQAPGPAERPNIILINLDDADYEMLSPDNLAIFYPNLQRFASDGIRFTNFHVTTPLCGPSRACLFRGQYAHNTGVRVNDPFSYRSNGFDGGMHLYGSRGYHQDDLGTWMKAAGYRTMMIGKYLHGDVVDIVPGGWDDFYSSRGANYFLATRFTNEDDPQGRGYLDPDTVNRTVQESSEARMLIDRHVVQGGGNPFFMYVAPLAPHQQTPHSPYGMVEEQYLSWWQGARMPLSPDVQEADFSDKSSAIRDMFPLGGNQATLIDSRHRERLLAVKSVDDMVGAIFDKLTQHNLTDNTYIMLTSDNGFSNGHHRMIGKGDAFDRSTHVPAYVIGPGIEGGTSANHLLAHIDIAPTVAELGGAIASPVADGKSFAPLLFEPQSHDERTWRDAVLIENWETRFLNTGNFNTASLALRFFDSVYVEWANGSNEFYDLALDPHQIQNTYDQLPESEKNFLSSYLKTFRKTATEPNTTISDPFEMNALASRKRPLSGMAEDDSGIDRVRLVIKRFSDSFYWNGEDWQPGRVSVFADVTCPGQQLTTWTYSQLPDGQPIDDLLGIWARAYDDAGQFDRTVAWTIFRVDYTRPRSTILGPEKNQTVSVFEVNGIAEDEGGVEALRMVIRDRTTNLYWNGSEWVAPWSYFLVPVKKSGRWIYTSEQMVGSFYVSTRAVDASGNVQSPPTQTWFNVVQ